MALTATEQQIVATLKKVLANIDDKITDLERKAAIQRYRDEHGGNGPNENLFYDERAGK